MPINDALVKKADLSRQVTLGLMLALVMLFTINQIMADLENYQGLLRWVIQSVPILFFARGIYLHQPRTAVWFCFVLMFYFLVFTVNLSVPGNTSVEVIRVILVISIFTSAMMYSRWQAMVYSAQENADSEQ